MEAIKISKQQSQVEFLSNGIFSGEGLSTFENRLMKEGLSSLMSMSLEVFQINLGYMCNQTCEHCHVDAGPNRKEIMDRDTMNRCLEKVKEFGAKTVDLTGGAPEMNPDFRWFVEQLSELQVDEIIVRSNLTIIMANPKYHDLPEFFKKNRIRVVSSLPCYTESNTDKQRGKGVFQKSIEALKKLNAVGYGKGDLKLDLVYNPGGPFLPGDQKSLETTYKKILFDEHQIVFNELFCLTNLPVNRFLDYLLASGNYEQYMSKLVEAFNPMALEGLMCRNTISIDYNGLVYDCDFNQMLDLPIQSMQGNHISQLQLPDLQDRQIQIGQHCYGCTAGAGSSCQGALI